MKNIIECKDRLTELLDQNEIDQELDKLLREAANRSPVDCLVTGMDLIVEQDLPAEFLDWAKGAAKFIEQHNFHGAGDRAKALLEEN